MALTATRPLDVLRWLLRFREVDMPALAPRALIALRDEALTIARTSHHAPYTLRGDTLVWSPPGLVRGVTPERLRAALLALQAEVRQAVETLRRGKAWVVPAATTRLRLEGLDENGDGFRCYRVVEGAPEDAFRTAMADAMVAGWHELGTCQGPGCARLFAPDDPRQKYCTPVCGQRARWDRFAPTRTRDYRAEYERRQTKKLGPKVRVGRRRHA